LPREGRRKKERTIKERGREEKKGEGKFQLEGMLLKGMRKPLQSTTQLTKKISSERGRIQKEGKLR